ncbi:hypothetical protein [Pelosinus propionicus]|uniref:Uncharacterized protein n=1 Tax=Pelosinus propionicus DSM 13327 TaxID=1123291 RepID=A0A1I4JHI0_9FIRM|nr:hypothetical protein [Pelosinus propionicus]SFL65721.1 hypothetical protein SAMN04490355_101273 [Pelosinus propionicus DSM 13327]
MIKRVKAIISKAELRNHIQAKRNAKEEYEMSKECVTMDSIEYMQAIARVINGGDEFAIQSLREHFERDAAMEFDTDRMIAIQAVRIVLEELGYNSEPIADYEMADASEYSKLVLAIHRYMSKAGVKHKDIRYIFDQYRVGGEEYNTAVGSQ